MSKLLTIVIPVYNTEKYLRKCLDSVIVPAFMDQLEILVVIDGSPDNSIDIAKEYESKYPNTFRVIDKENGGHGSCCNIGLKEANGKYIRFLDSDDWLDTGNFPQFLSIIESLDVDLIQTELVREYVNENRSITENRYQLIAGKIINARTFNYSDQMDFITMANSTFRLSGLRDSGVFFAEKAMFDDIVLYVLPFITIKTFYCMNMVLYHYYIGRVGQSIYTLSENSIVHKRRELKNLYDSYFNNQQHFSQLQIDYLETFISGAFNSHYVDSLSLNMHSAKKFCSSWNKYVSLLPKNITGKIKAYRLYNSFTFFFLWLYIHMIKKRNY